MLELLRDTPLWVLAVILVVAMLVATEIGRMVARRSASREGEDKSNLSAGMLGIFALLIAFTYSLSLARYDKRRGEVLEEANAIGTTANYAAMLAEPHRSAIESMLRRYTVLRTNLGSPNDAAAFKKQIDTSNAVLTRLWTEANAVTAEQPQSLPAYRFVAALNEQTNIAEARVTALRTHVPVIVLLALAGIAGVALGFAGWSAVLGGFDRHVGLAIISVTIALLITLTVDLDRPDRGSIEISKQPLRDALAAIPGG